MCVYLGFRAWYDNWRGPLRADEIDHFLALAAQGPGVGHTELSVLRRFLDDDDGREFVMCNLVRLQRAPLSHPLTGEAVSASSLMQEYVRGFLLVLFRYAGHPVVAARKVGGYVDAWQTAPDPGWTLAGMMRYRSRRDLMRLALHPGMRAAHPFKVLATAETFSFPGQMVAALAMGPRASVALSLALLAALGHLGSLLT